MKPHSEKSPIAGRMGKAAEYLVASLCILVSQGRLNVSTSMVDDEGVDLIFHQRGGTATLAVQVKARMLSGSAAGRGRFLAVVRPQTFDARKGLAMLFVAVNDEQGRLDTAWLVPSVDFEARTSTANGPEKYRFSASLKPRTQDQWAPYRLDDPLDLPGAVLRCLDELESTDR